MRIIGQTARLDLPYEEMILSVEFSSVDGSWEEFWCLNAYEAGDKNGKPMVLGKFRDRGAALAAHSRILADYADGKKVSRVAADSIERS